MLNASRDISTVKQGEFRISQKPNHLLCCILGSCIATCIFDPVRRIGGMNHFLLPGADPGSTQEIKYGAHAMEQLVNALLRAGASRHRFQVQIYGGAKLIRTSGKIGQNNAQFAHEFVIQEGFRLLKQDVGGGYGRRLSFEPASGVAKVEKLQSGEQLIQEARTSPKLRPPGSVELF